MSRWFVTFLYALMLACAAMPASSQVLADVSGHPVALSVADEATADDPQNPSAPTEHQQADGALEVPELFDGTRASRLADVAVAGPPGVAATLAPPPFLKGPQRPPRDQAHLA
jgi:hypothetical protein